MKVCNKCNHPREFKEYNRCSKSSDGLQYSCRDCERIYDKNRREARKAYCKIYQSSNKEYIKLRNKEWREKI